MKDLHHQDTVTIQLFGGLKIIAPNGKDLTPRGAKAGAMIALIATHADLSRSRVWLQDKLWSDRGRVQGAASLRQTLLVIRKELGSYADIVKADRRDIYLNPSAIEIDLEGTHRGEFLEGIDIRDEAFEDWLRLYRQSFDDAPRVDRLRRNKAKSEPISVLLQRRSNSDSMLDLAEELFSDLAAQTIMEGLPVALINDGNAAMNNTELTAKIRAFHIHDDHLGIRVSLEETDSNTVVWSGTETAEARGALPIEHHTILKLGNQLKEAIAGWLSCQADISVEQHHAANHCLMGIRQMYRFTPEGMAAADAHFAAAIDADPKGRYLAWRANLRVLEYVERLARSQDDAILSGLELIARALEDEPNNSTVLALAADAQLVFKRDVLVCDELSNRSIQINPTNPLGWWSQATAQMYGKNYETAHKIALKARALVGTVPHRYWWDFQCALTSAVTGRTEQAIREAEVCSLLAPNFKAPLRYLTALYSLTDDMQKAEAAVARLKVVEPDFTPDRMANDEQYPVGLMRQNGLLDKARIVALG